jgi:hypothetical protein
MQRLRHPIRSIREPFGKAGLTVAILALVLAMVGGAFAAAGLNGKQKKEVTKIAKKFAGKPGPAGQNGAAGANGLPGAPGKDGTSGKDGTNGTNGQSVTIEPEPPYEECGDQEGVELTSQSGSDYVCNGEDGAAGTQGIEGKPWTAGGTLPVGSTETGTWLMDVAPEQRVPGLGNAVLTNISFQIPLAAAPTPHFQTEASFADFDEAGPGSQGCTGSVTNPTAPGGHVCVYLGPANTTNLEFGAFFSPDLAGSAGVSGVVLAFSLADEDPGPEEDVETGFAMGSFAVTG